MKQKKKNKESIFALLPKRKRIAILTLLYFTLVFIFSIMILFPLSFFFPFAAEMLNIATIFGNIFGICCSIYIIKSAVKFRWAWLFLVGLFCFFINIISFLL